ncbi:MAG: peptidylprolyl isomerase, partial [Planctomycetota bacterium]
MKNATRRIGALLLALIVFVVARPTRAQDAPNDPAAAFAAAFERSKAEVRKIEALYSDFQTAPADRRSEINEAIQRVVADAKPTFDAMIDAALQAFRAAPNADPQVTDVLVSAVRFQVVGKGPGGGGDQYEAALPILEALVDAGIDQPELPMWGVLAAVVTNEFDLADKFAKVAIETGAINAEPEGGPDAEEVFGIATSYLQGKERLRARWEAEKKVRVAEAAADTNPRVELTTNKGPITIELFEDQAPTAVANFVTLVKDGFYDGLTFHRVIPHFMAQGGDPRGTGSGGPGYSIACECYRPDARM